jgi:hypothetical protein
MRRTGLILAIMLTLANAWAMAAPASMMESSRHDAHACCRKDKPTPEPQQDQREKSPCSGQCLMACCRMPVTQADPAPRLVAETAVVRVEPTARVALHTLTDPDPIFHPPRV